MGRCIRGSDLRVPCLLMQDTAFVMSVSIVIIGLLFSSSQYIDNLHCFLEHAPDMESGRSTPPHPNRLVSVMSWRVGVENDIGVLMRR